jgi:hypothetical protein
MKVSLIFLFIFLSCLSVFAQEKKKMGTATIAPKKIALVMGNQNYAPIKPLHNTLNDARDMKDSLEKIGFKVMLVLDAGYAAMDAAISKYLSEINKNDTVFVYFSGHGINYKRHNYLIPVDMDLLSCGDDISKKAISLEVLSISLNSRTDNVRMIFMDACRNLTFLEDCVQKDLGSFSMGFSKPVNIPRGTFIGFAAQEGESAYEVLSERNSRYTDGLLKFLNKPALSFRAIVDSTTNYVVARSQKKQIPTRFDELLRDFYFKPSKLIRPAIAESRKVQAQCQNCTRQSGYFKAMESGIGLSETTANERARLNVQSILVSSMIAQLQVASDIQIKEAGRENDLKLKDELIKYIKSDSGLTIFLYEDECKTISNFQNDAGQNVFRSEICGRIPIKPNLKSMELYLKNSNLPKSYIKDLMAILEDSLTN